jgi:hypothetical protein
VLFTAKDMLVVVDDFVPAHAGDRAEIEAKADRVFRGSANGSGRQRMTAERGLPPAHPSRCLPLATGEELPKNFSGRARILVVEVAPGSIDLDQLTKLQADAESGRLAEAMSAFLAWIAGQLDAVRRRLKVGSDSFRKVLLSNGWHGRTTQTIAELMVMAEIFGDFLVTAGAIPDAARQALVEELQAALRAVGAAQTRVQRDADPVDQFVSLLSAALRSGRAHLCSVDGGIDVPKGREQRAGWTTSSAPHLGFIARGQCIGWIDGEGNVYLQPDATDAAVQQLARDQGTSVLIGTALHKRLRERGMLASTEVRGDADRLLVRRTIGGVRRPALHIHEGTIWPDGRAPAEVAQLAQSDARHEATDDSGGPQRGPLADSGGPGGSEGAPHRQGLHGEHAAAAEGA